MLMARNVVSMLQQQCIGDISIAEYILVAFDGVMTTFYVPSQAISLTKELYK